MDVKLEERLEQCMAVLKASFVCVHFIMTRIVEGICKLYKAVIELFRILTSYLQNKLAKKQRKKLPESLQKRSFRQRIQHIMPALQMYNKEIKIASEYIAKGMGLMAGYEGRQARFNVFHLRGGCPGGVRAEVWSYQGPLPIERRLFKDRLEVSYVPPTPGIYTVLLTSLGRPLAGSPFTVKVDEACYAPPFISPLRSTTVSSRVTRGIIDFSDEEMTVTKDGNLISFKRPNYKSDQRGKNSELNTQEHFTKKSSCSNVTNKLPAFELPPRQPTSPFKLAKTSCNQITPFIPTNIPKVKPQTTAKPIPNPRLGFKMSNYVTRQESIETLKGSRNIQKLITKFESSIKELDENRNTDLSKKFIKDLSTPQQDIESTIIKKSNNKRENSDKTTNHCKNYNTNFKEFNGILNKHLSKESKNRHGSYDLLTNCAGSSNKVNRSRSMNVYLERISSLFNTNERKNEGGYSGKRVNDADQYATSVCSKVNRSSSLYDKPRKDNTSNSFKPYSMHIPTVSSEDKTLQENKQNSLTEFETKLKELPEIAVTLSSSSNDRPRINTEMNLNSNSRTDRLYQEENSPTKSVRCEISSYKYIANEVNNINSKPPIGKEVGSSINTLGNIYYPPMNKNIFNSAKVGSEALEASSPEPSSPSSIDVNRSPSLYFDSRENEHILPKKWKHMESPTCDLKDGSLRQRQRMMMFQDSSSSREDEYLNDITEPVISFDISLSPSSSSDSDSLSFDRLSPVIHNDCFQFQPPPPRRPSLSSYFEPDVIGETETINTDYNLRQEWNDLRRGRYENARFALSSPRPEEVLSFDSHIFRAGRHSYENSDLSLGNASNITQCASSFTSLNLPPDKKCCNDTGKNEFEPPTLNNSKLSKFSSLLRSRSSLSLDEKKLLFCKFSRFCSNIGLKKSSRGSFTVNRNNSSKNKETDKNSKFKFMSKPVIKKKQKEINQKITVRPKNNYSTFHIVRGSQESINLVGKMKDYWNNINKTFSESTSKEKKAAKIGAVSPRIVADNKDRFEKMGKMADKYTVKDGFNSNEFEASIDKAVESKTKGQTNNICGQSIPISKPNVPFNEVKPWKLLDFVDKTPKSPFSQRKFSTEFISHDKSSNLRSMFDEDRRNMIFESNRYSHQSDTNFKNIGKDFTLSPKRKTSDIEQNKIGKFDKMLNKDALLASLRSFDTESAYCKTFQDSSSEDTAGYETQYPHVPVRVRKEITSISPFCYKASTLRISPHDK